MQRSDGVQLEYINYTYDGGSDTKGNLTLLSKWITGSRYLNQQYSYNTGTGQGGTLATATDPNLAVTNYSYAGASCNSAFPTSVSVPKDGGGSLTTTYAYNCTGAVVTSVTDPNSATVSTSYTDPYYWRPYSTTDQTGVNTTIYSYLSTTPPQVESVLTFDGGNAAIDMVNTSDQWGRPQLQQKRQGPSGLGWINFDTVETDYDSSGRVYSVSQPATCHIGQTGCATVNTTTTYDAMGRPLLVTAADGGATSYSYNLNDVEVTAGQSRQMEYDGLGRLSSVCEITSGSGAGCGQNHNPGVNGYVTTYGYDAMSELISVGQGSENRSFSYDRAQRMLAETNPETGTTTYTYDSDSACGSSTGDMVKKVDAAATTCFYYDQLHRLTNAGYSGPVCRRYQYDSATVNGTVMANVAGRLAEASTDNCGSTQYTDEGFSYTARGEGSDVYESTPNSAGYYHVTSTYWADGAVNTLSGIPGVPTITYGVNVGGRPYTVSASSGQNPITNASYNAAGQLINLTYGSGDTDSFDYFGQTGRFKQYKYNVGSPTQTIEGDLTWFSNGTMQTLSIVDGTAASKSQNCNYTYDDLGRIATVNCQNTALANIWNQVFTYDRYGNITKTIPAGGTGTSFQPTYSTTSNQFTSIPGVIGTLYDAVGNLLEDGVHTYTWDINWGNISSIDGKSLNFDALGRMVEQTNGSAHTQIAYAPSGDKIALMNGQVLRTAYIPLLGGAQAVYNPSGLYYYRHSDWLGSSRLAVYAATRSVYFDGAYAPFGEPYDYAGTSNMDFSFTGQNQDTTIPSPSGIYDFLFREQSPVQGRWTSPDPAGLTAVDMVNPQTWNRYAYVANNPVSNIDLKGLDLVVCGSELRGTSETGYWSITTMCDIKAQPVMEPPGGGGESQKGKYFRCCNQVFGGTPGKGIIPGTDKTIPSYVAMMDVIRASDATGESAATIAATLLAESNGKLDPKNFADGSGADVGPMQLNTAFLGADRYHPANAYGTALAAGQVFNGNAYLNILAGASYLKHLGDSPWNYVGAGTAGVPARKDFLQKMTPKMQKLLDCMNKDK